MALPTQITDSLKEAEANIRNALAFAARSEQPIVCSTLTQILADIKSVETYDTIMDKLGEQKDNPDNPWKNLGL